MKRAARASPADATRRPSMESWASAARSIRVRSTVATEAFEATAEVAGGAPAREQAATSRVNAKSERRIVGEDRELANQADSANNRE